jgi:hypothetical protein
MAEPLTVLVAARDEAERIATTVRALASAFPEAELVVADDGSGPTDERAATDRGRGGQTNGVGGGQTGGWCNARWGASGGGGQAEIWGVAQDPGVEPFRARV